jgi:UDP-N-acetylmuramate--alanine ligase
MFTRYRVIHFIGIGGIGMSGIAEILHNLNYEITGSDIKESDTTRRLSSLGIKIFIGHDAKNLGQPHVVVISSAVSSDNPEVIAARQRSIPVIPRAEMLAELGRLKYGILVAGAHGKTTTTSLLATILAEGGLDPTVVIGGKLKAIGSNARLGQGNLIVAEADESDGSFLKLNPTIAVVTNIDKEHLDFFKNVEELKRAFVKFINKIPFYGTAAICLENEHIIEIMPEIERRIITYGFSDKADIHPANLSRSERTMSFEAFYKGAYLDFFTIPIPGEHNVLNSLAAIAVSLELQIPIGVIKKALKSFSGIQRRFELKGEHKGIKIFDDYGHHPTEIKATLKAARGSFETNRLVVIFQPHRYTRTRDLIAEFAQCFDYADSLYLMDIYPAGEKPIEGVHSEVLYTAIEKSGCKELTYMPDRVELVNEVIPKLQTGDIIITLGAGDVYKIGEEIYQRISHEG